jgi:hypothetical protein
MQWRTTERISTWRKKMQNASAHAAVRKTIPTPANVSNGQTIECPLMVTQEAVEAYERRTGFVGIGRIMVEDGHWIIVTKEELAPGRGLRCTRTVIQSRASGV